MIEPAPSVSAEHWIATAAMRKATRHLVPLIAIGYGCAYMDRVNVGFAALQMNQALHFSGAVYGFGAGLFFLSYSACEIPSNLLLYRFGARRWLARIMFTWGLIAIAMLFVRTPWEFYTARFFLGMAEAGFFPGVLFYLMQWFPPDLRARTVSRFYISLPLSATLMGLVGGGLLKLDGRFGMAGWQWLFLVEGLPPIALSVAYLMLLPDTPTDAKWLSEAERNWIVTNVNQDRARLPHNAEPIGRALFDRRVWQVGIFEFFMLASSYGYILILPQVIQRSTHLSVTYIGFITAGISLLGVPAMLLGARHSDRARKEEQERYRRIIPWCVLMAAGLAVCGVSTAPIVAIPALCLVSISYNAMQGPFWALPPSFFKGRSCAAAIAAVNTIGILGGFIGPYYMGFVKDLTGDYQRGLVSLSVPMVIAAGIMFRLYRRSRPIMRTITLADAQL